MPRPRKEGPSPMLSTVSTTPCSYVAVSRSDTHRSGLFEPWKYLWSTSIPRCKFRAASKCVSPLLNHLSLLALQKDAPQYRTAFAACIALAAVWLASVILHTLQYVWSNKRIEKARAETDVAEWKNPEALADAAPEKLVRDSQALKFVKYFW